MLGALLGKDSTREQGKLTVTYEDAARAVITQGDSVVIHLKKPFAPFLSIVAAWSFVMPKAWAARNGDWDGSPATWQRYNNPKVQDRYAFDHMKGPGQFKLQQWDRPGKTITLVRNEAYWRKPARVARVVIRPLDYYPLSEE